MNLFNKIGIIFTVLSVTSLLGFVKSGTPDPKIRKNLLGGGYDRMAQPFFASSIYGTKVYGTTVTFPSLNIIHYDIDDEQQTFEVHAWIFMTWLDPRLKWSVYSSQDISGYLHFTKNEIWRPDIALYNTARPKAMDEFADEAQLLVQSNGTVIWVPPIRFLTNCKMNLINWPFDVQECNLKLGSWTFHENEIDLQFGVGDPKGTVKLLYYEGQQFPNNTEWVITDFGALRTSKKYSCCPENYVDITYNFVIARKYSTFLYTVIFPVVMISCMTVLSFFLNANQLPRFILGTINLLIIGAYLIYFRTRLPTVDHTPNIVKLFTWNFFVNTMSILIATIMIGLPTTTEHFQAFVKLFQGSPPTTISGKRKPSENNGGGGGGDDEFSEDEATGHDGSKKKRSIMPTGKATGILYHVMEFTDPIAFCVFTFITIIMLISHLAHQSGPSASLN